MIDQRWEGLFTELHRAEYGRLLRFVTRRASDRCVAEDLTADVFRVAWDRIRDGSPISPAWLFVTARKTLSNHYRSVDRLAVVNQFLVVDVAARGAAHSPAHDVWDAMADLTEQDREILVLRYWDGLDGREIAALLGISLSATWVRLHRARQHFANIFRTDSRGDRVQH